MGLLQLENPYPCSVGFLSNPCIHDSQAITNVAPNVLAQLLAMGFSMNKVMQAMQATGQDGQGALRDLDSVRGSEVMAWLMDNTGPEEGEHDAEQGAAWCTFV